LAASDAAEGGKIRSLSEWHLGVAASATTAAALGIFTHHADTPQGLRLCIKHAMKEGLAKFVVCTSTLRQSVNFPLKYLIVTSTRQGAERIMVRDFQNLMGRAGRAGMHTEGNVIFSTPSILDQRTDFRQKWRWDEAKELVDASKSEPSLRRGIPVTMMRTSAFLKYSRFAIGSYFLCGLRSFTSAWRRLPFDGCKATRWCGAAIFCSSQSRRPGQSRPVGAGAHRQVERRKWQAWWGSRCIREVCSQPAEALRIAGGRHLDEKLTPE